MTSGARYREHIPTPLLRRYVACYWTLEARGTRSERILPDGCMDLLFDVRSGGDASVVGTMSTALVSTAPEERTRLLGIRFRPGEAYAFLGGVPARAFKDTLAPLQDVWGAFARELADRLVLAPDTPSRLRLLDAELLGRRTTATDPRLRRALDLLGEKRALRVPAIAGAVGLGERQLERLFHERVGLGPKVFARITRVQRLLTCVGPGSDWSALAADLGWSDQAHLTRDLRELAGITPAQLGRALRMSDSFNPPYGPLPIFPP
ncbi:MAG TPA: helix-turn-helix domain-containing protein [Polyangiaceae bacterium]